MSDTTYEETIGLLVGIAFLWALTFLRAFGLCILVRLSQGARKGPDDEKKATSTGVAARAAVSYMGLGLMVAICWAVASWGLP